MRVMQLVVAFLFMCSLAQADEFYVLGGVVKSRNLDASSYSWQLEYMHNLVKHLDASLSYLNEGHLPNHHRDGGSLQLWARTDLLDNRISLAVGAGPYYFDDSTRDTATGPYLDEHGFGGMFSLAATYRMDSRWLFQLRTNWVKIDGKFDTVSATAGIGYQLEPLSGSEQNHDGNLRNTKTTDNTVTLYLGQTVLNSEEHSEGVAASIEYRRGLYRCLDWTAAWLYEGNPSMPRRNGGITQLWAVRPFLDDRMGLGAGLGVYIPLDDKLGVTRGKLVSGMFSMTASYRFYPHLETRFTWNRILTDYNMDADVLLGGVGYLF